MVKLQGYLGDSLMDLELFFESSLKHDVIAKVIENIISDNLKETVTLNSYEDQIVIGTKYFSLALEIEDISDINFVKHQYNLFVNYCISIQLFSNITFYKGLDILFKFIGLFMKECDGNLLFLEDGSHQLIRKEDSKLIVNSDLDQYQIKYLTPSLLSLLDHSYEKEKLEK